MLRLEMTRPLTVSSWTAKRHVPASRTAVVLYTGLTILAFVLVFVGTAWAMYD